MSRVVIVPLAPSLFSARVIPPLVELGRRSDIHLHVVDAWEADGADPAASVRTEPALPVWRLQGRTLTRLSGASTRAYTQSVASQLAGVLGSTRVRVTELEGDAETQLAAYAREVGAALVVIGVEAHDGRAADEARERAEAVAARADTPVFLVTFSRDAVSGTLVSALDGAEADRTALELALTASQVVGAEDLLVQALPAAAVSAGRTASAPPPRRAHA